MGNLIKVNFDSVYSRVAELRARLEQGVIAECEEQYRRVDSLLQEVDGATNAALIETAEASRQKTEITANTMLKLLEFIENATMEVQKGDQDIARQLE